MWFKIKNNIHTIIIIIVTIAIGLLLLDLSNNDDSAIIIRTQRYNNYIGDVIGENGTYILKTNDKGKIIYNHPKAYNYLVGYSTIDHGSSGLLKLYEQALYDAPRGYNKGATMTTTINTKLQNDCYSLLNGLEGSIVVLERNTGKVKAIVSCSGNDFNINDLYEDFDSVIFKDNLVDRATQTQEAPGSTFKSVITALAIENNQDTYIFNDVDGSVKFDDGSTIHNYHGYSYGKTNLAKALNKSSNVYFSSLAVALKKDNINSLEKKLLLNQKIKLDFTTLDSTFDTGNSTNELATIGIGQGKLALTPVHLAMIYQGLADGKIQYPYIVEKIERSDHKILYEHIQKKPHQIFKRATIKQLDKYLLKNGKYYGFDELLHLRAKTGTAQINGNKDHTYVASYDENYVVVVSINNGELSSNELLKTTKEVYEKIYQ